MELQMERERLASAERVAAIQAQAQAQTAQMQAQLRSGGRGGIDAGELAERLGQAFGARMDRLEEALEGVGGEAANAEEEKANGVVMLVNTLNQALAMFGPLVAQKMMGAPPSLAAPEVPHGAQ
jgi:hypothetical protein